MSVSNALDRLRAAVDGCNLVAFVDLGTQMVLAHSAVKAPRQERLDALAATAARVFDGEHGVSSCVPSASATGGVSRAVLYLDTATLVLLRAEADPKEALCCRCAPGVNSGSLFLHAQSALAELTRGG